MSKQRQNIVHLTNGVLLIAVWVFALWKWSQLPSRIPLHFSFNGLPDSWGSASILSWFFLPAFATLLTICFYSIRLLIRRWPELINFPTEKQRKAYLCLSLEQRKHVFLILEHYFLWLAVPLNIYWLTLEVGTYLVAKGVWASLPAYWLLIFLPVFLGITLRSFFKLNQAITNILES